MDKSSEICSGETCGSLICSNAPSSKRSLHIEMAADSLVSFVSALKANPSIAIFFPETVPKSFLTINLEILF